MDSPHDATHILADKRAGTQLEVGQANPGRLHDSLEARMAKYFPLSDTAEAVARTKYSDLDVRQIADLLQYMNEKWSLVPRSYIVLRTIRQLHLLDMFIAQGITDFWFPFSIRSLPDSMSQSARREFLESQWIVLTKATDLENGDQGNHQSFSQGEPLPFKVVCRLGSGAFGEVDKVQSLLSRHEYARKQIIRGNTFSRVRDSMESFTKELQILKRVKHHHIIEIMGSYTDPKYVSFIMSPVADTNLAEFFHSATSTERKQLLRSFFGCISNGLAFLHDANIRHKDIKPSNILVKGKTVLLADFGLAFDWVDAGRSTTQDSSPLFTPMYCAPEVLEDKPRNSSSDIWSLGCVFLEMVTVLKGKTIADLRAFFESSGSMTKIFASNQDGIGTWIVMLRVADGPEYDNIPLGWIQQMLRRAGDMRPKSNVLVELTTSCGDVGDPQVTFCGPCCMGDPEHSSQQDANRDAHTLQTHHDAAKRSFPETTTTQESPQFSRITSHLAAMSVEHPRAETDASASGREAPPPPKASLFAAVKEANADRVKELIGRGVDVNAQDVFGLTALHKASLLGSPPIVEVLLENGAEASAANRNGRTALHLAVSKGHDRLVGLLIEKGVDPNIRDKANYTALHVATDGGHIECLKLLVQAGADLNIQQNMGGTALHLAVGRGREEALKILLQSGANVDIRAKLGRTALHQAAQDGNVVALALLLEKGADLNGKDDDRTTAVYLAAGYCHEDAVMLLLERGAEVECPVDENGRKVLHMAAEKGNEKILRALLDSGAKVNAPDDHRTTALHMAASKGHKAAVEVLLERGAELNGCENSGGTALHKAVLNGHQDVARLLIDRGADINAHSLLGATPLHIAAIGGHEAVAVTLLEAGADMYARTNQGWTVMDIAESEGQEGIAELLVSFGHS